MLVRIQYKESPYFRVYNISVVGSFNSFVAEHGVMLRDAKGWYIDVDLDPGEYVYKFLINDEVQLCDPMANIYATDEDGNVWSVMIIDGEGQRLYDNKQYELSIEDYLMSSRLVEPNEQVAISKKKFNLGLDEKAVARFGFKNVTGEHEVSLLWYKPNGTLYSYSQNCLSQMEDQEPVFLWFWILLGEINEEGLEGEWIIKLFIDGSYILEDHIMMKRGIFYQPYGGYVFS